tara:strand:- start:2822 stop:4036 length:1215 start_codon:yes stop_codon:yes gene_type:complete
MIELLLVIIIALICLAIYGTTYYFLKVKVNSVQDCPICPDCNVSCPENVCPQCEKCPERQECPEIQESGFKANLYDLKKLFNSIKHVNQLTIEKYCTSADSIKAALDEKLVQITILDDLDCKNVLNLLKSEILIKNESEQYELSEEQQRENKIINHTFEIAELLINPENCQEYGKTNKVKVVNLLKNIIDAFCYDDYEESADQTGEESETIEDTNQEDTNQEDTNQEDTAQEGSNNEYLSTNSAKQFCIPDENQDCPIHENHGEGISRGGICYYREANFNSCSNIASKDECHIDVSTYAEDPDFNQKPIGKYVVNDDGQNVYCVWKDESNSNDPASSNNGKCEAAGMCQDDKKLLEQLREGGFEDTQEDCENYCAYCNSVLGPSNSSCISACAKCVNFVPSTEM